MSRFSDNLHEIRTMRKMSQKELGEAVGVTGSCVGFWERCRIKTPDEDMVQRLASALNVSPVMLQYGLDEATEPDTAVRRVPKVGDVVGGLPKEPYAEWDEMVLCPDARADYALRVDGNSMSPTICDGDTIFVKATDKANSGDICVIYANERTTLKRIKYHGENNDMLDLVPDNDEFPVITFKGKQLEHVTIQGVVVAIQRIL